MFASLLVWGAQKKNEKKKWGKHLRTGSLCNIPDLDHPSVLSCLLSVVLSAAGGFRGVTGKDVPMRSLPATATGPSPFLVPLVAIILEDHGARWNFVLLDKNKMRPGCCSSGGSLGGGKARGFKEKKMFLIMWKLAGRIRWFQVKSLFFPAV